jgi:hypothetical protein
MNMKSEFEASAVHAGSTNPYGPHHPGEPSGFEVQLILGNGDLWITEYPITYPGRLAHTVSIMEFRNEVCAIDTEQ